jgi:alpha-glucosidase
MFANNHTGYSAMGFVDTLGTIGASVTFAIAVDRPGRYDVTFRYANATGATASETVVVGDEAGPRPGAATRVEFPHLADWDTWSDVTVPVNFEAGVNLLMLARTAHDVGAINLNYIELQI